MSLSNLPSVKKLGFSSLIFSIITVFSSQLLAVESSADIQDIGEKIRVALIQSMKSNSCNVSALENPIKIECEKDITHFFRILESPEGIKEFRVLWKEIYPQFPFPKNISLESIGNEITILDSGEISIGQKVLNEKKIVEISGETDFPEEDLRVLYVIGLLQRRIKANNTDEKTDNDKNKTLPISFTQFQKAMAVSKKKLKDELLILMRNENLKNKFLSDLGKISNFNLSGFVISFDPYLETSQNLMKQGKIIIDRETKTVFLTQEVFEKNSKEEIDDDDLGNIILTSV